MKAIAGIPLAGCVAGLAWLGWTAIGCGCSIGDRAKFVRVEADFNAIGQALRSYRNDAGHYPSMEQGLIALVKEPKMAPLPKQWKKMAEQVPRDPWQNEYQYQLLPGGDLREFEIRCLGPDGMNGTPDDISSIDPR